MKEVEISLYTQAPSNASGPLFSRRTAMIQPRCTAIMALCHPSRADKFNVIYGIYLSKNTGTRFDVSANDVSGEFAEKSQLKF